MCGEYKWMSKMSVIIINNRKHGSFRVLGADARIAGRLSSSGVKENT